jgi:hypothetical protein
VLARAAAGAAIAVLALAGAMASAQPPACLSYEPQQVSIEGRLDLRLFPGPPHFKSIDGGDFPDPVWMLTPKSAVCLDAIPGDDWSVAQPRIESIQIQPRVAMSPDMNGRTMHVDGTLYRPRSGHPRTAIVLRATSIAP